MTDDADVDAGQNVGLVVVSHSRALARAAVALAAEMLHGRAVRIEVAAGLDETTFGTDAVSIKEAIERADGPAGVVVLMDLGSAVLSAELALDLLRDPSARDRVTLSPAPIVEGLVVAAVAAAGGASRAEVAAEARDALMGKAAHLSAPTEGDGSRRPSRPQRRRWSASSPSTTRTVCTPGRPPGWSARCAPWTRRSQLRNLTTGAGPVPGGKPEPGRDAGALHGHEVEVRASGSAGPGGGRAPPDARQAPVRRERRGACARGGPGGCRYAAVGHGRVARRTAARFTGHRDRAGPPADRRAGRRRPAAGGRAGRGVAPHRRGGRHRASRDRARPGPHGARGGRRGGQHLRRAPVAARRRRDARRRQGPHRRRRRGRRRLGGLPGRGRTRVGRAARPLPARARRGRARGRRPGAARPDRRRPRGR